jgi:hypothetical protein
MKSRRISTYPSKKLITCATFFILATTSAISVTEPDEEAKKPNVSEEEAMYMFSQANLDGVRIMDLPDAPQKEAPTLSDELAVVEYQAHQSDLEKS